MEMNFIVSSSSMAAVNTFYGFPGISRTYINFPVLEKCQKKFQDPYEPCRSIHCMSGCSSVDMQTLHFIKWQTRFHLLPSLNTTFFHHYLDFP